MSSAVRSRLRRPRGALRRSLLDHAVELVAEAGPDAMSLREVQRRAGVSPAAAYRHYPDREALLLAVGQRSAALLADHLQSAIEEEPRLSRDPSADPDPTDAGDQALRRLRFGCLAYIDFARREPNLFRTVFLTRERPEQLENPAVESVGTAGRGAYEILQDCLEDLAAAGLCNGTAVQWTDTGIWSATHGFAVLTLDGPLQHLDADQRTAAADRLLDLVLHGLTHKRCPGNMSGSHVPGP